MALKLEGVISKIFSKSGLKFKSRLFNSQGYHNMAAEDVAKAFTAHFYQSRGQRNTKHHRHEIKIGCLLIVDC